MKTAHPRDTAEPGHRRTWRRRLLDTLPRLGVHVADIAPGVVVVSRRSGTRVTPLDGAHSFVLSRKAMQVRETGLPNTMLVTSKRDVDVRSLWPDTALLGLRGRLKVVHLGPGAALATQPAVACEHRFDQEKRLHRYLMPEHLAGLLDHYRVNCVLDVGANKGQYGQLLRRVGYEGHIVSFEPVPDLFAALQEATAGDDKWSVHQVALGRTNGKTSMHVVPGTLSSMLAPSEYGARRYRELRETSVEQVPVRRLDELLDDAVGHVEDPRLFLKLDTQGYDLEVFAGLGERTTSFVGMQSEVALLQIYESMPRLPHALELYEAAGFGVTGFFPVTREGRTWRVLEFDCIMVRADAL